MMKLRMSMCFCIFALAISNCELLFAGNCSTTTADCYTVRGIFKSITKLQFGDQDKIFTVLTLIDDRVFVLTGAEILVGPVGTEVEIQVSKDVRILPQGIKALYPGAISAIKVNVLSMPTGKNGIRINITNQAR